MAHCRMRWELGSSWQSHQGSREHCCGRSPHARHKKFSSKAAILPGIQLGREANWWADFSHWTKKKNKTWDKSISIFRKLSHIFWPGCMNICSFVGQSCHFLRGVGSIWMHVFVTFPSGTHWQMPPSLTGGNWKPEGIPKHQREHLTAVTRRQPKLGEGFQGDDLSRAAKARINQVYLCGHSPSHYYN